MELSTQSQQSIRHQFDAFCKKVVKYEMINCYREQDRRGKREVVFSDLPKAVFDQFAFASYDAEAMTVVVRQYKLHMTWLGVKYHDTNTETHGRMETKLMLAILQFKVK